MGEMFQKDPLGPEAIAERKEQVIISFRRMLEIKDPL
jgi:hypothetical protein